MELLSDTDTRTLLEIERDARALRSQALADAISGFFARLFHRKPVAKTGKTVHTPA